MTDLEGMPLEEFMKHTSEACEHLRFFGTNDGEWFVINMVKGTADRLKDGPPKYLLCEYCQASFDIGGSHLVFSVGPEGGRYAKGAVVVAYKTIGDFVAHLLGDRGKFRSEACSKPLPGYRRVTTHHLCLEFYGGRSCDCPCHGR